MSYSYEVALLNSWERCLLTNSRPRTFCSVFSLNTGLNEITNQECTARTEMEGYRSLTRTIVWYILKGFDQNKRFKQLFTKMLRVNWVVSRTPHACRQWQSQARDTVTFCSKSYANHSRLYFVDFLSCKMF